MLGTKGPKQGGRQFAEGFGAGLHLGDAPVLGSVDRSRAKGWDQPGGHRTGLPAARVTHRSQEGNTLRQRFQELVHWGPASEEVFYVFLREGSKPLVGVADDCPRLR